MKRYAVLICLFFLPRMSRAQSGVGYVQEVAYSTGTVRTFAVSTGTPTNDMANLAVGGRINGAFAIEIYNISSSTNNIYCGYDAQVSSISTNNYYGREIAPGVGMVWHILQNVLKVFCTSQGSSGGTVATVTQIR